MHFAQQAVDSVQADKEVEKMNDENINRPTRTQKKCK